MSGQRQTITADIVTMALSPDASREPPSAPEAPPADQLSSYTRDVLFLYSDAYFRVLWRLPVHPKREQMTFSLLHALSTETVGTTASRQATGSGPFGMHTIAPSLATDDQLLRFHSKDYVDTLRRTSLSADHEDQPTTDTTTTTKLKPKVSDKEREEYELVDDAYVFPGLYEYCRFVAGASITAADALLHLIPKWRKAHEQNEKVQPPIAINLGGGRHHAMRSQASGFCYVNDVVLAIQRLLSPQPTAKKLERVLCVDVDVHHGDGVQEAFYFSANTTTMSFHLMERAFFPGTGAADEIGVGRGKHHNINVPLKRGITDAQFTALFERILSRAVECVDPEVVVLICGVDTLSRDSLGGFNLTSKGISDCVKTVVGFNLPLLLLGAGGYSGADACRALAAIVSAVVAPELDLSSLDVPEHEYYEEYGPDFRMATKPVIHRPNENTAESLDKVATQAITTLEKAKQTRTKRTESRLDSKRKRAPDNDES